MEMKTAKNAPYPIDVLKDKIYKIRFTTGVLAGLVRTNLFVMPRTKELI